MVETELPSKQERIKEKHWRGKVAPQNNGSFKLCGGLHYGCLQLSALFTWVHRKLWESREGVMFTLSLSVLQNG